MKLSYKIAAAIAATSVTATISTPATAGGPPELSATELAQVQSRRYGIAPKAAFNATLSTLQTLGFVDIDADRDAGTISGVTDAKAKTIYNIFWGFGKKKWTQKASILIEEDGLGSRVRVNMMLSETKARGIFGTSFTDGKIMRHAEPYQVFFGALDAEIASRGGSATTTSALTTADGSTPIDLGNGIRLMPAKTPSGYCIQAPSGYVGTGSASRPAISTERPLCS
jgi:hypothetical protein